MTDDIVAPCVGLPKMTGDSVVHCFGLPKMTNDSVAPCFGLRENADAPFVRGFRLPGMTSDARFAERRGALCRDSVGFFINENGNYRGRFPEQALCHAKVISGGRLKPVPPLFTPAEARWTLFTCFGAGTQAGDLGDIDVIHPPIALLHKDHQSRL